ncbi:MAG TPA: hypothetical protein VGN60_03870 [Devosia sp.]|nr:hypothetical protein [Devosia sp.]
MQQADPRRYVVPGASSGIGLSVMRLLAAQGHHITAAGQRDRSALPPDFPDIDYQKVDLVGALDTLIELAAPANRTILIVTLEPLKRRSHMQRLSQR